MGDVADFDAFYRAVHRGRQPFPWQVRLARMVDSTGWPAEIGVPTGLGKTSCLDIAVWALARQAGRSPGERTAPTRTWYVVNRRLLVDAAFDHGCRLSALLADPAGRGEEVGPGDRAALEGVAHALASMRGGGGAEPLYVTRLRGGADLGARPPDPSQPAVIFATVPMFASRWLFRGYGTSTNMRPVDAALAGIDTLVLLDEAHLARPMRDLTGPLAECDPGTPDLVLPAQRCRPVLVSLTATGDRDDALTIDDEDEKHPVVRQRLDAAKPVRLVGSKEKAVVTDLVSQSTNLLAGRRPSTAVVFVNRPATARAVFERLAADAGKAASPIFGADLELLTGRVRDREGDAVRARLLDPVLGVPAGRPGRADRERHLVVVATQTLEVGADLDFDVLVTEACGARALVQRLGRLNRLGQVHDAAGALVFAGDAKDFGIYGDEPRDVWERLRQSAGAGGMVDLSPRCATFVVGPPDDTPDRVGTLLPAHVWEWAKTTQPPEGEAPPELFFAGFDDDGARVTLSWRVVVPENECELRPPANAAESVDIPLREARDALTALTGGKVARLRHDRVTIETDVPVDRLRPGDHVVVPAHAGGYDRHGWAPEAREAVFDVSLLRPPGIPLVPEALRALLAPGEDLEAAVQLAGRLYEPPEPDEESERADQAIRLLEHFVSAGPSDGLQPGERARLLEGLKPKVEYANDGPSYLSRKRRGWMASQPELRSDAFDGLSCCDAKSPALAEHLASVGQLAGRMAERLGFDTGLVEAVAAAGRFHDLGKADVRFQRWLDPVGVATQPLAKSSQPWFLRRRYQRAAGWPGGGHHEELSRRLVEAWLDGRPPPWDADLVLHLVVSHHGFGRPLVPGVTDHVPVEVSADIDGDQVSVPGDLDSVDWGQPARFRRCCERYGYWGLALLEAVLRQADHQASSVVVA